MTAWQRAWHRGFAPGLSTPALEALARALETDDARLLQGRTTEPPPLVYAQDWPVAGACAIGFCGWQGDGWETVAEIEEYFARACWDADRRLGEPAGGRHFLNWYDDTPRSEMRALLLVEVRRVLDQRKQESGAEANRPPR